MRPKTRDAAKPPGKTRLLNFEVRAGQGRAGSTPPSAPLRGRPLGLRGHTSWQPLRGGGLTFPDEGYLGPVPIRPFGSTSGTHFAVGSATGRYVFTMSARIHAVSPFGFSICRKPFSGKAGSRTMTTAPAHPALGLADDGADLMSTLKFGSIDCCSVMFSIMHL